MTQLSVILALGAEAKSLKVEGFLSYIEDPDLPPTPFFSTNQTNKQNAEIAPNFVLKIV